MYRMRSVALMRLLRLLGCALFALLLTGGFTGVAAAQDDDDTGYSLDAEALPADDDTGYQVGALPDGGNDAEVLGTSLARTGSNVLFLVLIGGAAIAIGVGLDRWSKGLEVVTATNE